MKKELVEILGSTIQPDQICWLSKIQFNASGNYTFAIITQGHKLAFEYPTFDLAEIDRNDVLEEWRKCYNYRETDE